MQIYTCTAYARYEIKATIPPVHTHNCYFTWVTIPRIYKIPSTVQTLLLLLLHGFGKWFINYKCSRRIFSGKYAY